MSVRRKRATRPARPLRSDARRNRQAILDAAVAAFSADASAPLEGIARAAGVGIGTLYRHYPTREALLEAAYRDQIETLCAAAPRLLARNPPDVALGKFLDRFIAHMNAKRGMIEALRAAVATGGKAQLGHSLAVVAGAVAPIIEAGRVAGVLRDDVTVDDFLAIKGAIVHAAPDNARRLAELLLDGLRYRAPHAR